MNYQIKTILAYSISSAAIRVGLLAISALGLFFLSAAELTMLCVLISFAPLFTYTLDLAISKAAMRFWFSSDVNLINYFGQLIHLRILLYLYLIPIVLIFALFFWSDFAPEDNTPLISISSLIFFGVAESTSLMIASFSRIQNAPNGLLKIRIATTSAASASALFCFYIELFDYVFLAFAITHFLVIYFFLIKFYLPEKYAKRTDIIRKRIILFAAPLTVHDVSWWMKGFAISIIVSKFLDPSVASGFFISIMIASPIYIFISGFDQAYAASYYAAVKSGSYQELMCVRGKYRYLLYSTVSLFFCVMFFCSLIKDQKLSETLVVCRDILPFLFLGPIFQSAYVIWVKPLMYAKRTTYIGVSSFLISALTLFTCHTFILNAGHFFAALLSVGSILITGFVFMIFSKMLGDRPLDLWMPIFCILISSASLLFFYKEFIVVL